MADANVEALLTRVATVSAAIATISLLYLFSHSSFSCRPSSSSSLHATAHSSLFTLSRTPFPRSSCDALSRRVLPLSDLSHKTLTSTAFRRRSSSFASSVFLPLRGLSLLSNRSRVLCVSAGAGHEVDALLRSGVADVTGVDVIDFPPLVSRSDPHNLPFFDGVFDLGFSAGLDGALFPARFVGEMERTVRKGGVVALAVGRVGDGEVDWVTRFFKKSTPIGFRNVTLVGEEMTLVIMRNNAVL